MAGNPVVNMNTAWLDTRTVAVAAPDYDRANQVLDGLNPDDEDSLQKATQGMLDAGFSDVDIGKHMGVSKGAVGRWQSGYAKYTPGVRQIFIGSMKDLVSARRTQQPVPRVPGLND